MKFRHILAAAGMALAALGLTAPAQAQTDHHGRPSVHRVDHGDRARSHREVRRTAYAHGNHYGQRARYGRPDRDWQRNRRHEWRQARYHGYAGYHRRCHTEWRHHRRVRICR